MGDTIYNGNFIIKLDSLGNIVWLTIPRPENYTGFPNHGYTELEFGSNGNPYVFAMFNGSCTYNGFAVPDSRQYVLETKQSNTISLSNNKPGLYFIKLTSPVGNACTWKVVKQ